MLTWRYQRNGRPKRMGGNFAGTELQLTIFRLLMLTCMEQAHQRKAAACSRNAFDGLLGIWACDRCLYNALPEYSDFLTLVRPTRALVACEKLPQVNSAIIGDQ